MAPTTVPMSMPERKGLLDEVEEMRRKKEKKPKREPGLDLDRAWRKD